MLASSMPANVDTRAPLSSLPKRVFSDLRAAGAMLS